MITIPILEQVLSEQTGEVSKLIVMQGLDSNPAYTSMLMESTGLEVETRAYQRIVRPDFNAIKMFIKRTIENEKLQGVNAIVGIYDGGAVPSMIAKHVVNNIRRQEGIEEVSVYPMRLRTTQDDGVCSNSKDNSVSLEYFIEPPICSDPNILIVEDIVSYGKTLEMAIEIINELYRKQDLNPKITTLSLVFNRERYVISGRTLPKRFHYAIETKDRDWVVFPWENDDGKTGVFV
jgi:hypoxanthine phosphoribosyltransferase